LRVWEERGWGYQLLHDGAELLVRGTLQHLERPDPVVALLHLFGGVAREGDVELAVTLLLRSFFFFFITLGLEMSDTKVYEP